jgi:hypothetical protein
MDLAMIEVILVFALATFINISGVKAAISLHNSTSTQRAIVTIEDVNDEEPESLLEALREMN